LIEEAQVEAGFFILIYIALMAPAHFLPGNQNAPINLLLLFPASMACMWARRKACPLFAFLLIHLALPAATLFYPGIWAKVSGMLLMLIICIRSISRRLQSAPPRYDPAMAGATAAFAFILCLITSNFGASLELNLAIPSAAAIILCLLNNHMRNLDESIELITRTTIQPTKSILASNNAMIAMFCAIAGAVCVWGFHIDLSNALSALGGALYSLLRFLLSFLTSSSEVQEEPIPIPQEQPAPDFQEMLGVEQKAPWWFWAWLENALIFLIAALAVVGVLALAAYLCHRLYKLYYSNSKPESDEKEFMAPEVVITKGIRRISRLVPNLSRTGSIRRAFKRTIRRHISKGAKISACDTPVEMRSKIGSEDISALVDEYQKVRY
jgi:hypothetical protein